jgi:hypothetical protein
VNSVVSEVPQYSQLHYSDTHTERSEVTALKAAMFQEKAISIDGKTDDCVGSSDRPLLRAERELGAFARAVNKLFGSAHVGESIEDWLEEFESMDWSAGGAIPDWRRVTIAAAARLASRVQIKR